MGKWQTKFLKDLTLQITDGKHGDCQNQSNSGYFFISCKDIYDGKINYDNARQITPDDYWDTHRRTRLEVNDILITNSGTIGRMAFINAPELCTKTTFQKSVAIVKPDTKKIYPKYLYYLLQNLVGDLINSSNGSAQKNLLLSTMRSFSIRYLEDIKEQRKIAGILSAYDDLIENNRKQIKLLEEAAQRLYKEWFIDLHFPGHEITPIIDGIPEGWERKTVEEFLIFHANGGWGKETSMGKCVNIGKVIRGTDIDPIKQSGNVDNIPIRYHSELDIKNKKLLPNDIVFELSNGNLNNIGRSLLINTPLLEQCGMDTICASFCKLLRAKNRFHAILLFMEIQDMQSSGRMLPFKKHGANGINNFDFESFLSHSLLYSNNADLLCHIDAIIQKIDILRLNIKNAIESRDRLLPKLMTGELEVK